MGRHRAIRTSRLGASEKENQPPTTARRTVSISTLFAKKHSRRDHRELHHRSVLAPQESGISKSNALRHDRAQPEKDRPSHAMRRDFAVATNEYRQGAALYKARLLEPVYEEFMERIDASHINGDGLQSSEHVSGPTHPHDKNTKPYEEQMTAPKSTHQDGFSVSISLGRSMELFQELLAKEGPELKLLLQELRQIDAEMYKAKKDILVTYPAEAKEARNARELSLAKPAKELLRAKEETLADVKKARKDDQAAKRKFDGVVRSLLEDEDGV